MACTKEDEMIFATGAHREDKDSKLDIEAAISPVVLERYAKYLHDNSFLPDGTRRPNDNWQKGIPKSSYMKSLCRHVVDVWKAHRGWKSEMVLEDALCAVLFNTMGYLYELLKEKRERPQQLRLEI